MGTTINFIGTNYTIPAVGEIGWGQDVTNYLLAISTGVLTRSGGQFTLTSNVNFGPTFGLETAFIQSRQSNPATAGIARLAVTDSLQWRNAANSGNLVLDINSSSNRLEFQASALVDVSTSQTLFNKTLSSAQLLNPTITGGTISGLTVSSLTGLDVDGNTVLGDSSGDTLVVNATSTFNAPVTIDGTLTVSSTSTFNDDVTIDGELTVSSNATFNGTSTFNGNVTLNGSLTISSALTLNDDLTVNGNTILDGTLTVSSTSAFNDNLTLNGSLNLLGAASAFLVNSSAGSTGQVLTSQGAGAAPIWATNAGGDVTGPASSTDNAIARFDSTTGKIIQNSGVIVDDSNNISGVGTFGSGAITSTGVLTIQGDGSNTGFLVNSSNLVTIGETGGTEIHKINGGLDASYGRFSLSVGADNDASTKTNATNKVARITSPHYTNAEEPVAYLIGVNGSSSNALNIGGGSSITNALTEIGFYTAATTTTTSGTSRGGINSAGAWTLGSAGGTETHTVNGNATFTGQLQASDGSVAAPSYSFNSDTDTGLFWPGTNRLGFVTAGANRGEISAAGAWSIGASGGTETHTVNGDLLVTVNKANVAEFRRTGSGSASGLKLSNDDAHWWIGLSTAEAYQIRYNADSAGSLFFNVTSAGAATIGAAGGTETHTVNGSNLILNSGSGPANPTTLEVKSQGSGNGNVYYRASFDRPSGTGAGAQFQARYGPSGSERLIGQVSFSNTDASETLTGGILELRTSNTSGTVSTGITIDEDATVTIGESGGTQPHAVNGDLTITSTTSGSRDLNIYVSDTGNTQNAILRMRGDHTTTGAITIQDYIFGDSSTNRTIGRQRFDNTNATPGSSGGVWELQTSNTSGTLTTAIEADESQKVTIGASSGTETHTVNGGLTVSDSTNVRNLKVGGGSDTTASLIRAASTSTSALTEVTQTAIEVGGASNSIFNSLGTTSNFVFRSNIGTGNGSRTTAFLAHYWVTTPALGTSHTVTRQVNFGGAASTVATNNAFITDNVSFTGNWFINSTSTNPSLLSGQLQASDGTAGAPSYSFSSDTDTGLFWAGTNRLGFVTNGVNRGEISATGAWRIGTTSATQEHTLNTATATSATAGSNGDVPAQVDGYITITINGATKKIPYYAD